MIREPCQGWGFLLLPGANNIFYELGKAKKKVKTWIV
jgi:hypothetical protein